MQIVLKFNSLTDKKLELVLLKPSSWKPIKWLLSKLVWTSDEKCKIFCGANEVKQLNFID